MLRIGSRCQLRDPARPARAGRVVVGVLPKRVSTALKPVDPVRPVGPGGPVRPGGLGGRGGALGSDGAQQMVTPRAATHSPQPVLPSSPARSQTGKPGTAVARTSPWLSR